MQIKVMHREQCFAAAGGYGQEYNTESITIPTMIIGKKVEPAMKGYLANSKSCIYTVGYTDAEGKTQEIQFEISHECAYGTAVRKLIGKFNEFCKENNLTLDSLTYVKRAGSNE